MALARAVAAATNIGLRQAPKYSSESQGSVERFHSTLWAMVRTLLLVVKTHYGLELRVTDDLVTWIVKHAVWLYNRYQVHSDGQTSYARRWGRNYSRPILSPFETVMFRRPGPPTTKTEIWWDYGIWAGKCTHSEEHFILTPTGVLRCRSVRRLVPSARYNLQLLKSVVGTPWRPKGPEQPVYSDFILLSPPPPANESRGGDGDEPPTEPPTEGPSAAEEAENATPQATTVPVPESDPSAADEMEDLPHDLHDGQPSSTSAASGSAPTAPRPW